MQIVHGQRRGSRQIEHIGSAHTDEEYAALKQAAAQRLAAGQQELDLDLGSDATVPVSGPLEITSSRMQVLWDTLDEVYAQLGFGSVAHGDNVALPV